MTCEIIGHDGIPGTYRHALTEANTVYAVAVKRDGYPIMPIVE